MKDLTSLKKTSIALAVTHALVINVSLAATITVNNGGDSNAGCTLREAVTSVNQGSAIGGCSATGTFGVDDTINFSVAGVSGLSEQILISEDLSINPNGQAISIQGTNTNRIFEVESRTDVSFSNVTIQGGRARNTGENTYDGGGAIFVGFGSDIEITNSTIDGNFSEYSGGAIHTSNVVSLAITNSTISNNSTDIVNYGGGGGAIYLAGSSDLSITNSTISDNTAGNAGGIYVATGSTVSIINSTIANNTADNEASDFLGQGGGMRLTNTDLTISNSIVSGNTASGNVGGGLSINFRSSANITNSTITNNTGRDGGGLALNGAEVTLNSTTISNNSAQEDGGGVSAFASGSTTFTSNISFINSTVSGNTASENGGAIFINPTNGFNLTASIINSTISGNTASQSGGGLSAGESTISLVNSLFSGNSANNSGSEISLLGGSPSLSGVNLFGDSSISNGQAFSSFTPGPNDITATSDGSQPTALANILSPLSNNGGNTQTHALVDDSPAVDAANNSICAASPINNRDQRGEIRPGGATCDIGSFEIVDPTSFFVVPLPNGRSVIFGL